jgi:hypothetical protein
VKLLLIFAGSMLLTLGVVQCPGLILVFLIMQPVFLLLFVKYLVFPDDDSESSQQLTPGFISFDAGQPISDLAHGIRAWITGPRWGRAQKLKNGVAFAVFCMSFALLYICAINPGCLLLYCVGQPLLIILTGKWMKDFDSAASLQHRRIRLERVAFDPARFNDLDLPRSCAICLSDFDGTTEPADSVHFSRISTSYSRNVVLLDGADAASCPEGEIVRLPCARAHCFHAGCIHEWLTAHGTCPICRTRSGEELPRWWIVWQWCTQFSTTRATGDSSLTMY